MTAIIVLNGPLVAAFKGTRHAWLRVEARRQAGGLNVPLQPELKCFYTATVLLSSGSWGVLFLSAGV